jgi:glycosyltransferase involved in cell wall biosynthesis
LLKQITPVLLTYNEKLNIHQTMARLYWAQDIVVVDSGSTDDTVRILKEFPQVRIFQRPFDTHGQQWHYATNETGISTQWILRLDADYHLSDALISELSGLDANEPVDAYQISFDYAVFSRKLSASLYPPNTILLRRGRFTVWENGHTESWRVEGLVRKLTSKVVHDDWKTLDRWMASQLRYSRLELNAVSKRHGGLEDWLRKHPPLMPIAVFLYCLFVKGLILDGKAGLFYTIQRTMAEAIVSLMLLEDALRRNDE